MTEGIKQPKPLPEPNVDLEELAATLPADELATLKQMRELMRSKVAPVINKYWAEDAFPFELLPGLKQQLARMRRPVLKTEVRYTQ
jgi:hypothetical protein